MTDYPRWHFYEITATGEKRPISAKTLTTFDYTKPENLSTWAEIRALWDARHLLSPRIHGIGFTFYKQDPFFFVDVDKCIDPTTGELDAVGTSVMQAFQGQNVFIERSQSGKGLHVFGVGKRIDGDYGKKRGQIEVYDDLRWVAVTWNAVRGDVTALGDGSLGLAITMVTHLAGAGGSGGSGGRGDIPWGRGPVEEWDGPTDDDELIQLMLTDFMYNAGRKHFVAPLWNGDQAALMEMDSRFVKDGGNEFDWSSADLSLMNALADFTGDDPDRMERLFKRSGLFRPVRWEESGRNYAERTIWRALTRDEKYRRIYKRPRPQSVVQYAQVEPSAPATVVEVGDDGMPMAKYGADVQLWTERFTSDILTVEEQNDLFRGCVYVESRNEIFTPDGRFVSEGQFKNGFYAGHSFILNWDGKTTNNAWEAFTQSRAVKRPKVQNCVFRPDLPEGVIVVDGERVLNTYVKANVHKVYGADVSRFTNHVDKMFRDKRDRSIIMAYMAAVVQYPGVKFQWCPVIQGTEGNGKSLLIRCLTYAMGDRYTHSVNSHTLADGGGKFNKWIENKLFIDFEEIYTGDRRDMMEILKPIITNPRLEIQGKGTNQYTGDNRANIMMATNHKDAIIKTRDDRRYAILYTAQQSREECIADGMTNAYFSSLYQWLREGGYAAVAGFLSQYSIPDELNPATGCQVAPETSCLTEAVEQSLGPIEQHIAEWVETGRVGFRGGFISSAKLEDALKDAGLAGRIAPNKRKAMLERLGYTLHPNLIEGKSPVELMSEGGRRPRIYVKKGNSIIFGLTDKNEIINLYCRSQNYAA